jgi:pimeloyl-ACP methyl ester carboxylesterase
LLPARAPRINQGQAKGGPLTGTRTIAAATEERIVPFTAGDGLALNLVNVRGEREPAKGPVLLVHGAGVRANIFRAPVERTLVDELVDAGYDVWLENWRASIDVPPNEWTLDQAAVHDHPAAVRKVIEETGADEVRAVIHCQGSTSFMMSAVAGLVPEVKTVVANAVTLHPVIPRVSRFKLKNLVPMVGKLTPFMNPRWGLEAPTKTAKALALMVRLTHHECDNPVCKMVSFTYGTGFPALWRHENLNPETHEWVKQEFAHVPLSFFRQMGKCVEAGHLVSVEDRPELPQSFVAGEPQTEARFAFFAGTENICFLPASQERTFRFFDQHRPGYHSLVELPGYGHLDVFMGQRAARDVFPLMLAELER